MRAMGWREGGGRGRRPDAPALAGGRARAWVWVALARGGREEAASGGEGSEAAARRAASLMLARLALAAGQRWRLGNPVAALHAAPSLCGRRSAKIATRKDAQSLKRSKLFGRFGKLVLAAARTGGGDPGSNDALAAAVAAARAAGVPLEIVRRNIDKATATSDAPMKEILFEIVGPGGAALVAPSLTDSPARAAACVRAAVKGAGKLSTGVVAVAFERKAVVVVKGGAEIKIDSGGDDTDSLLTTALDAGADDVLPEGDDWLVVADAALFGAVRDALAASGRSVDAGASGLRHLPTRSVPLSHADADSLDIMIDKLLACDDVDAVWSNGVRGEEEGSGSE